MNKFTDVIKESEFENFVLTDTEFNSYKIFINQLLETNYGDRKVILNDPNGKQIVLFEAYNYEKIKMPGREFSVLGKVNTNKILIERIWKKFNITSYTHLKNLINKLSKDLFNENGKFFKSKTGDFSVWDSIRFTEMIGENNEDYVANFIQNLYGPDSKPVREITSSYKDMILGIDITFYIDGVEKTCQVKPLKFDNFKERGVVIIKSSGLIKKYNTDFIAFVDPNRAYRNKCLLFKNEGGIYDGENQTITLPYRCLINKNY